MTDHGARLDEARKIGRKVEAIIGRQGRLHRCDDRQPLGKPLHEFCAALWKATNLNVGNRPDNQDILAAGSEIHGHRYTIAHIHPPNGESRKM